MAVYTVPIGLDVAEGPSDLASEMNVGDTIVIFPLENAGEIVFPVPEGFTRVYDEVGFGFVATAANVGYPYAQFQVSGFSGRQVVVSVVVYP